MNRSYTEYVTKDGDTFDSLALDFYGDENCSVFLMQFNPDLIDTLIFNQGVTINVPEINIKENSSLPPWKR